jgi:hypothetical protein
LKLWVNGNLIFQNDDFGQFLRPKRCHEKVFENFRRDRARTAVDGWHRRNLFLDAVIVGAQRLLYRNSFF